MEKKMTFNDDVCNYDRYRPNYPNELFDDIIKYSAEPLKNIFEIGAGTGQATKFFVNLEADITAIDIGENMVDYLCEKFKRYSKIKCICTSFEQYERSGKKFDLVYCATAFHWLDEKTALTKIKGILKDEGIVALFWNHPFVGRRDNVVHEKIRKIYAKYRSSDKTPKEFCKKDTEKYARLLSENGFKDVTVKIYYSQRKFTAKEYVGLLNTYSDHRLLPPDIKADFEKEIYNAIRNNGNEITIYDTADLYLGRNIID